MFQVVEKTVTVTEGAESYRLILVPIVPPYLLCPLGLRDNNASVTVTALLHGFSGPRKCPNGNPLVQVRKGMMLFIAGLMIDL